MRLLQSPSKASPTASPTAACSPGYENAVAFRPMIPFEYALARGFALNVFAHGPVVPAILPSPQHLEFVAKRLCRLQYDICEPSIDSCDTHGTFVPAKNAAR